MEKAKYYLSILLVTSFLFGATNSISKGYNEVEKLKKQAIQEFSSKRYHNAEELLLEVVQKDPHDAWFHYSLGISSLHTSSFERAIYHLHKAYELDAEKGVDKTFSYWLGKAYHQNHQFELAISEYKKYTGSLSNHNSEKQDVELLIKQAENGLAYLKQPSNMSLVKMEEGINSMYDDHSPIVANNGHTIYYTSKRGVGENLEQDDNGDYYEKVFAIQKNEMGVWGSPSFLTNRNSNVHHACIQLFDNERKMLVFNGGEKNSIQIVNKDLFGNWLVTDKLDAINDYKTDGHATISEDGKTIVFSKHVDKYKENGDLYFSELNSDGVWSKPEQLGSHINSKWDETAPYLSTDGTVLFFASNSDKSMGGYDVFKSEKKGTSWSEPINLGYPINSAYHDVHYQENKDKTLAVFASHREGGNGQLDMYMAYDVQMIKIVGSMAFHDGINPEDVSVYFNSFGENHRPYSASVKLNSDGSFEKELVSDNSYKVFVVHAGELMKEELIRLDRVIDKGSEINYAVQLPKEGVQLDKEFSDVVKMACEISHLEFDFNKSSLKKESFETLDLVLDQLKKDPTLKVSLTGYVDNIGQEKYNHALSGSRANVAADYLIMKGIKEDRVKVVEVGSGAGSSNKLEDSSPVHNRRTEVKLFVK